MEKLAESGSAFLDALKDRINSQKWKGLRVIEDRSSERRLVASFHGLLILFGIEISWNEVISTDKPGAEIKAFFLRDENVTEPMQVNARFTKEGTWLKPETRGNIAFDKDAPPSEFGELFLEEVFKKIMSEKGLVIKPWQDGFNVKPTAA